MSELSEKGLSLKECQEIMLNILSEFAEFCDRNDLKYYLDAGTLLGAVRHKGFIPWDNDMDICFMRPDYDRLLNILKEKDYKINDHLILERPEDSIYAFSKVGDLRTRLVEFPKEWPEEGYIYIDVFPKDGIPALDWRSKLLCGTSAWLSLFHWYLKRTVYRWAAEKHGVQKWVAIFSRKVFKNRNFAYELKLKLIRHHNRKYPLERCEYVTTLVNGEFHLIAPRSCFDERVQLEFEGCRFYAPKGYDTWLRILYGDTYMELPPEGKRGVHDYIAEWRQDAAL